MAPTNKDELVKRIAKLAKQNQDLEEYIKKLEKMNEKLSRDVEKYKTLLGQIEETENQLKSELAAALAHHFVDEVA